MMDVLDAYAGLLNASSMVLLLLIIVAFYINLTVEALRHAGEEQADVPAFDRGRQRGDRFKPAGLPLPYRRASSRA
jgi:hypothetical protein